MAVVVRAAIWVVVKAAVCVSVRANRAVIDSPLMALDEQPGDLRRLERLEISRFESHRPASRSTPQSASCSRPPRRSSSD